MTTSKEKRQDNLIEDLMNQLDKAIETLELNSARLVRKAFDEGGDEQVQKIFSELDTLRSARFELIRAQLDKRNPSFIRLAEEARDATKEINREVENLEDVSRVIKTVANAVNLAARILVLFAI